MLHFKIKYITVKRFLDIVFSIIGIILAIPIFLIVAIAIKINSRGPIIFKQKRIGKDGKVFEIYKFRTMVVGAEKTGTGVYSKKGDSRVTKVGNFLRMTSIDEFPQFFNILKGEMSFIGPRPVLTYHPWEFKEYTAMQLKRFNVKPGITGWAQIHGRKDVPWDERIKLDVYYVDNISFIMDLKIMIKTVANVILMKDNVNSENKTAISNKVEVELEKECSNQNDNTNVYN